VCVFGRHSAQNSAAAHRLLDPQRVRDLLHPRRARALLDRRVHRVLHHVASLPLLSLARQQPRPATAGQRPHAHLVPALLLLWVVHRRHRPQWVRVAVTVRADATALVPGRRWQGPCFVEQIVSYLTLRCFILFFNIISDKGTVFLGRCRTQVRVVNKKRVYIYTVGKHSSLCLICSTAVLGTSSWFYILALYFSVFAIG